MPCRSFTITCWEPILNYSLTIPCSSIWSTSQCWEGEYVIGCYSFKEFEFEVVVKPRKYNVGPDHLSWIESGEASQSLDDELPDVKLFHFEAVPDQLADIIEFLTCQDRLQHGILHPTQHHQLVTHSADYQLIVGQLYKLGVDGIYTGVP
jgi:hypothetical protein